MVSAADIVSGASTVASQQRESTQPQTTGKAKQAAHGAACVMPHTRELAAGVRQCVQAGSGGGPHRLHAILQQVHEIRDHLAVREGRHRSSSAAA